MSGPTLGVGHGGEGGEREGADGILRRLFQVRK
jgi:hypothetical protein